MGQDTLTGGGGQDVFFLNTNLVTNAWDIITDFNPTDDTISFDRWGYWSYDSTNGTVLYDSDGDFSYNAIQVAVLGANLTLTSADFIAG